MDTTREILHRVGTHVVARARHAATGRFGLRATPGGFGTPAFGDAVEVIRVAGTVLIRERDGKSRSIVLDGCTLAGLAAFAGVDLAAPFSAGDDTPDMGDPSAVLSVESTTIAALADWLDLGWRVLDAVTASADDPAAIQLWPEHFDAGTSVAVGSGPDDRCNLGASLGDSFSDEPYLYVGPWSSARPGDAAFWNAPFGAVLRRRDALSAGDPQAAGVAFMCRGLELLAAG